MMNLKEKYFYDIMLVAAGLIGSLVMVGNKTDKSFRRGVIAIFTGVAVSYFFTPIVVQLPMMAQLSMVTAHKTDYAVAFFLGTTGWQFIVWVQKAVKQKTNQTPDKDGNIE
jgi:hypothetical protein